MTPIFLSKSDKWLLSIIGSTQFVKGRTRLQKYGILVYEEILKNENGFFNDWRADNYGGYSPQLAISLRKLERRGCVKVSEMINQNGEPVERYELTDKGSSIYRNWVKDHQQIFEKIAKITGYYFNKGLSVLLDDVYSKYPQYTPKSKIRAEVNKTHTNNQTYLSPEFEHAFDEKEKFVITSTVSSSEFVFNDEDFRKKLAESIGLKNPPSLDPKSFESIKGIIAGKIKTEKFDSVELVNEVRGS
jgi:uncharacterized protein